MNSQAFTTLMRREWLQHRTGWLLLVSLPVLLMLALAAFGGAAVHLQFGPASLDLKDLQDAPAALHTLMWSSALPALVGTMVLLAVAIQLPGLARRDVQDRSIEFWRSLPVDDRQAVAALLTMHLLVLPAGALLVALAAAQLLSLLTVSFSVGPLAWLTQPWWQLLPALLAVATRVLLGLLLAVLWASPLLLGVMAASAWLKRWGMPVVGLGLLLGVQLLDPRLPQPVFGPALQRLALEVQHAFIARPMLEQAPIHNPDDLVSLALPEMPVWALHDAGQALARLASPALLPVLLGAAAGFALLVWRRRRA